jgi:predicted XRE-type DNA-binding protein
MRKRNHRETQLDLIQTDTDRLSKTMTKRARVARRSGNVFKDIGLPDAEELVLKADIVIKLAKLIELRGLTQSKAAAITGIAQPDLSKLLRGHFSGFSMDRLVQAILSLGSDVEIRVKKPAGNRRGRARVTAQATA